MDSSLIVFAGIILGSLLVLPLSLKGLHKLAKDYFKFHNMKIEEHQNKKIEESKEDLKKIVDSGNLTELIDAAKQLGDQKKK